MTYRFTGVVALLSKYHLTLRECLLAFRQRVGKYGYFPLKTERLFNGSSHSRYFEMGIESFDFIISEHLY